MEITVSCFPHPMRLLASSFQPPPVFSVFGTLCNVSISMEIMVSCSPHPMRLLTSWFQPPLLFSILWNAMTRLHIMRPSSLNSRGISGQWTPLCSIYMISQQTSSLWCHLHLSLFTAPCFFFKLCEFILVRGWASWPWCKYWYWWFTPGLYPDNKLHCW
jgi:hypothetical protein